MEAILTLAFLGFCFWGVIKIIKALWPTIKFLAIFVGAFFVLASWFLFKEVSALGLVLGAAAVCVASYKFAKEKSN